MKSIVYSVMTIIAVLIAIGVLAYNTGYIIHFLFSLSLTSLIIGVVQEKKSRKPF